MILASVLTIATYLVFLLQSVIKIAARMILLKSKSDNVTSMLKNLQGPLILSPLFLATPASLSSATLAPSPQVRFSLALEVHSLSICRSDFLTSVRSVHLLSGVFSVTSFKIVTLTLPLYSFLL